ncbi:MAG: redox-sensing transcriptional repressor Rex [Firmicutes bacterium]|nr:redox-sensing transcriptional repressor Rex [Bacillota bacterium]MBQ9604874.1 redox-sensing transcriptional repressor Rex [Bacillota bacterium]
MMDKDISIAVIKRLPRYYRYLGDLLEHGITRISSNDLAKRMNLTASQIRQDLNKFGCFGQQGYGYNVELLYEEIKSILGLERTYNLIIIGGGNLGQTLANYGNFQKRGFKFTAIFDKNPRLIGLNIRGLEILDVATLETYLKTNSVDIAVLALPKANVSEVLPTLVQNNISGIWNFSHVDLKAPDTITVENVHLTDSLLTLSYRLSQNEKAREKN